jgi:glycosyltransferase involved in cell wall biosynthesis
VPTVSICIPTYMRPDLLKVAVESCLAQTFQDFEIVISDDSSDTRTETMVRSLSASQPISYVRNVPGLGQAKNVNQLFNLASGEFLVLLHDDDFLMPNALADLITPLQENTSLVASFGKQYLATHEGKILDQESKALNERYSKTDDRANKIQRPDWSALAAQFPPDGYMVSTAAARAISYRDDPEIGEACDADFSLRLAKLGPFFFVSQYVSAYRRTQESISSKGLRVLLSHLYFLVQNLSVPADLRPLQEKRLRELAPVAVNGCLLASARRKALGILASRNYPWNQQFAKGIVQLGLAFTPQVASRLVIERHEARQRTGRQ